jgi:hypothetical protein
MDLEEGRARMGVTSSGPNPASPNPAGSNPAAEETFSASRWTRGNLFFPTRIVVSPLRVSRVKRRLFGSSEENISISQVASVKISTGMIWSDIVIESTGGTDPITSHGHRKGDAVRIRDLVEGFQAARR